MTEGAGSSSGSQGAGVEEGQSSGYEDDLALDELEDVELHPDVVPRRGVKVLDNKARAAQAQEFPRLIFLLGCTRKDQKDRPTRPQVALDRNSRSHISRSTHS